MKNSLLGNQIKFEKYLHFIHEIGTIMYVGGILSHIVIGILFADADASTYYNVYVYKEQSAYILILPGLALKIFTDLAYFFQYKKKPNWLKTKLLMVAFLSINAFVFLVPMMPELVQLAKESIPNGKISQAFLDREHTEQIVGQMNIIPLALELVLGSFKPKLGREKKQ